MTADSAALWAAILVVAVGSYAYRLSFIELFGRVDDIPPSVERALELVPAAVLAAILAPYLLLADGSLALSPGNDRLIAAGVAAVVAWYTESMLATIVTGMAVLWALTLAL